MIAAAHAGRMAGQVFWLVLPSLPPFLRPPVCLRRGMPFPIGTGALHLSTGGGYVLALSLLGSEGGRHG